MSGRLPAARALSRVGRRLRRWRRYLGRLVRGADSAPAGAVERACGHPNGARGRPYDRTLASVWRREP